MDAQIATSTLINEQDPRGATDVGTRGCIVMQAPVNAEKPGTLSIGQQTGGCVIMRAPVNEDNQRGVSPFHPTDCIVM